MPLSRTRQALPGRGIGIDPDGKLAILAGVSSGVDSDRKRGACRSRCPKRWRSIRGKNISLQTVQGYRIIRLQQLATFRLKTESVSRVVDIARAASWSLG